MPTALVGGTRTTSESNGTSEAPNLPFLTGFMNKLAVFTVEMLLARVNAPGARKDANSAALRRQSMLLTRVVGGSIIIPHPPVNEIPCVGDPPHAA